MKRIVNLAVFIAVVYNQTHKNNKFSIESPFIFVILHNEKHKK